MRTEAEHDQHIKAALGNNKLIPAYGVRCDSPLPGILSYHPTRSLPADIMHDLLKEVQRSILQLVIDRLILTKISTDKLVEIVQVFSMEKVSLEISHSFVEVLPHCLRPRCCVYFNLYPS